MCCLFANGGAGVVADAYGDREKTEFLLLVVSRSEKIVHIQALKLEVRGTQRPCMQ